MRPGEHLAWFKSRLPGELAADQPLVDPGAYSTNLFYGKDFGQAPPLANPMRPSQLMFQCYYQMKVVNGVFFQTSL